ncbi:MAG: HAMP domain-containing sensor histidine kinase [Burkholderiaceae bacterium]
MDGREEQLKRSIRFRLSLWLSLAILVVSVVAGLFSFVGAYDEAHETQDDVLRQVASLLRHQRTVLVDTAGTADADPEARLFVQYFAETKTHKNPVGALPLPSTLADGLQTVELPRASYRVLVASSPDGARIAVAQETAARNELAQVSAMRTVLPLLILVPILLLVVADIVRKLLQPVARLAAEVESRGESELHALPEQGLPSEVLPFVVAINRMLGRVSEVLHGQRRFIADAAHELRSPMTALSLQAERLGATELPAEARERLEVLRRGIERGRALLEQLLAYARVQSVDTVSPARCEARSVVRRVLEDLMPLAEAKHIDIGMEAGDDVIVAINDTDLGTVLKNLIENAIRYTPAAGRVDIDVQRAGAMAVVVVTDSGPGIAPGERERVLQAFYRTLGSDQIGSGLGLAIVKTIVDRSGAQLRLDYADEKKQSGLRATVSIPIAVSAA